MQPSRATRVRDPLDIELGDRIRRRRAALGLAARQLGERVGVSQQQIRRYELGDDRMSAAMLIRLAGALGSSVGDVCEGIASPSRDDAANSGPAGELVASFTAIRDPIVRKHLLRLVRVLAHRSHDVEFGSGEPGASEG